MLEIVKTILEHISSSIIQNRGINYYDNIKFTSFRHNDIIDVNIQKSYREFDSEITLLQFQKNQLISVRIYMDDLDFTIKKDVSKNTYESVLKTGNEIFTGFNNVKVINNITDIDAHLFQLTLITPETNKINELLYFIGEAFQKKYNIRTRF